MIRETEYTTIYHYTKMLDDRYNFVTGLSASYDTALKAAIQLFHQKYDDFPSWEHTTVSFELRNKRVTCFLREEIS